MIAPNATRRPVTIVCVFNNPRVRERCLDRSIAAFSRDVEYIPVDNTDQRFPTAGAALNFGIRRSSNPYVVLVHQDVWLHSLGGLEHAAGQLATDSTLGLVGALGIGRDGRLRGRIRDRVVLLGESTHGAQDVESLDEVLFVASRQRLLEDPLVDSPDLAWHAYAVEYGLRARRDGLRVGAVDIGLTHNSMTINLARLTEAHAKVADLYPAYMPVRTTCGTVGGARRLALLKRLAGRHRWRYTWLRESASIDAVRRSAPRSTFVLADIRREVDELLAASASRRLDVINLGGPAGPYGDAVDLPRRDVLVRFTSVAPGAARDLLGERTDHEPVLVTNIDEPALGGLVAAIAHRKHVIGYHGGIGLWLLVGDVAERAAQVWRRPAPRPLALAGLREPA